MWGLFSFVWTVWVAEDGTNGKNLNGRQTWWEAESPEASSASLSSLQRLGCVMSTLFESEAGQGKKKEQTGKELTFLKDKGHGDDVSVRLSTAFRLSDALFSTLTHLLTHAPRTLLSTHAQTQTHARHLQIQCCGAFRHSSHGLNERWAFRKKEDLVVFQKGAKTLSENKKNILLGI